MPEITRRPVTVVPDGGARGLLRGITHLSIGTTVAQGMTVAAQLLFAVWLGPADFGYWATASSALMLLSGLVNFGEVNGYLTSPASSLRESRRAIWRMNALLLVGGAMVAVAYLRAGRPEVALLVAVAAVNLPLLGESNLLYAAYLKGGRNARLVKAQALSAVGRTAIGVGIAWSTGSALAIACSMLCYSLFMIGLLAPATRTWPKGPTAGLARAPRRRRAIWSVHSLCQMLPTQMDFFVISLVASPELLGIYFLSYQTTVGISGLVAGPLSKSSLSALSARRGAERSLLGQRLMVLASGCVGILACLGVATIGVLDGMLPTRWQDVAATISLLLASLPARFLTALLDSLLMAEDRWLRSAGLNVVGAFGIGLASLTALTGNVRWLATAVVVWIVVFTAIRIWWNLVETARYGRLMIVVPNVLVAGCLVTAAHAAAPYRWVIGGLGLAVAAGSMLWPARQPDRAPVRSADSEPAVRQETTRHPVGVSTRAGGHGDDVG